MQLLIQKTPIVHLRFVVLSLFVVPCLFYERNERWGMSPPEGRTVEDPYTLRRSKTGATSLGGVIPRYRLTLLFR